MQRERGTLCHISARASAFKCVQRWKKKVYVHIYKIKVRAFAEGGHEVTSTDDKKCTVGIQTQSEFKWDTGREYHVYIYRNVVLLLKESARSIY